MSKESVPKTSESFTSRAVELVKKMTLREKISQMIHHSRALPHLGIDEYNWWNECLHGVARAGVATVFPQAIGLAATWNAPLLHRIGEAISDEARAKHHEYLRKNDRDIYKGLTFWSPNVNIFRDPRWGRGHETYGECPFLTSRLAVSFIRGLQGDDPKYLKVCANAKHYAVHSGPEPDRHTFDARVSVKDLRETYLPAFRACVCEAKVGSVMGAYNRTNGELCCAAPVLMEKILREEWGFDGYYVSDCGAIADFHAHHHVTQNEAESAALAVRHGCDLNCGEAYRGLLDAVKQGLIEEKELDRAVIRLMRTRLRLGMFDPPEEVPYAAIPYEKNDCPEHRELALNAARQSLVLLRNENKLLPLDRQNIRSIAVIGPNAASQDVLIGNYFGTPSRPVTLLDGIRRAVEPEIDVYYAQGSTLFDEPLSPWIGRPNRFLSEAVSAAERADITILCLGLSPRVEGEEGDVANSDGGGDRTRIDLYDCQQELLKAVCALNKPVVLVLTNGSAVAINWAAEHVPAILDVWYPGGEGGVAVAEALFGEYNPGGRLPITFYRSMDDLPPFTDYAMKNRTYRYFTGSPLYPFGFGLSYTRFRYSKLRLSTEQPATGESVNVSAEITNIGEREGDEVAQLYVRDLETSCPAPRHELRGFQRISLAPGETREVSFTLTPRDLALVLESGATVQEPGRFQVFVGGRQPDTRSDELADSNYLTALFHCSGAPLTLPD